MEELTAQFWDVPALLRLHDVVAAADPDGPPAMRLVYAGESPRPPTRLGFLAGSFNPLHSAHEALARAAMHTAHLDRVLLVLSKRTVDKERVSGMSLEDRLLLLQLFASTHPGLGVALVNRGLYVEQAALLRSAWPNLQGLWAVVGFDKIVQILDPRYYADRDAALDELFALATVLVAPRAGASPRELHRLLDRPENRRFRDRVRPLPIPPEHGAVSSSRLRAEAEMGRLAGLAVPELVRAFVEATRVYAPPLRRPDGEEVDAYGLRVSLIAALARARPWAERQADLRRLLGLALGASEAGRTLRAWLRNPPPGPTEADLRSFQGRAG